VGGGIGGLAAGLALRNARIPITVLEAQRELSEVGAAVSLWPNAMHALRKLKVADEVWERGAPIERALVQRWDGKVLSSADLHLQRRFGAPGVCIRRADLVSVLRSALGEEEIRNGAQVASVEMTDRGAAVLLAGGGRVEGSILIGADGLHSTVRRHLIRDEPRYLGSVAWRGLADLQVGAGIAVGHLSHAGWQPVGRSQTYWFCCRHGERGARMGDRRGELLEHFGRWWDPVPALIQATNGREILRHDLYDRPPALNWGVGPLTLLGDAAHPMAPAAGQGACFALEDAAVLGACLAYRPGNTTALRLYESQRVQRAARMQRASRAALRTLQPRTRAAELARDLVLRLPPRWLSGQQSWMFDFRPMERPQFQVG
jgi:2-polyprenyl-6-methoxyphenol hydroxylase-like FAD-dependent oxidoreductase